MRENGRVVVDVEGPGANVATLSASVVEERLAVLFARLGDVRPAACCAGSAGAEVPAARERLEQHMRSSFPGCRVRVVHDARLVLAAARLEAGIALVAGTGSVAYGRTEYGREAQRGGWGWMIGDDGAGVWITREAAREVMRRADAALPIGPLGEAVLRACNSRDTRDLTANLHTMHEPMQWASLAKVVFDSADHDAGAIDVICRAATALADLVKQVQGALGVQGPVVLAGGLILNQPKLEAAVREQLGTECIRLGEPAVEGAIRLAEELITP